MKHINERAAFQINCEHQKCDEIIRTLEVDESAHSRREYTLLHLCCTKCGMMFGRSIFHAAERKRGVA